MRPSKVQVTNTSNSAWIPVNFRQLNFNVGIQVDVISGTPTWSVQLTLDDIFDSSVTPSAITAPAPLDTGTVDEIGNITIPCTAVRLSQTGTGVSVMTVVQGS